MKPVTLLPIWLAAALLSIAAVACSTPDVQSFNGKGAQAASGDDDDDSTAAKKKTTTTTTKKTTTTTKPTTGGDDDDGTTTTTTTKPATTSSSSGGTATPTTGTTTMTPQACFTHCVQPVPEAALLDTCANGCADGDADCLSGCYESSGCGENPQCDQAVDQCNTKCEK